MEFVSFHTHSTFSYGDGFGTVAEHVRRVADLGMSAVALSEHGNVNSHVQLEKHCVARGIKPIFGIEAYFSPPEERSKTHITLFAMDEEGYRNLNRIVTQSYLDFKQFPTVTWESLKENNRGIVALSGCSDSLISCTLLGGKFLGPKRDIVSEDDFRRAYRRVQRFADVFCSGRFFLEVQRFPGLDRTCALNPALAQLSTESGIPLIATADVHYPFGTDNKMQTVLHAGRRSSSVAITEAAWEYDVLLTYPESDQEIIDDLIGTGLTDEEARGSVQMANVLAGRCTVELPKAKPLRFRTDAKGFAAKTLKTWLHDGWLHRVSQRPDLARAEKRYFDRIKRELKVIIGKDFCDYFLATAELLQWAKSQGITVGPARGSAAASVVCYCLQITEIDPLTAPFNRMVFERFIDPTRSDMPDIDLDFDDQRRYEVEAKAREIYGKYNVANVGNHIGYRGRKALDDVARAYGLPLATFKSIKDRISDRTETDERVDDSIEDVLESYSDQPDIATLAETYPDQLRQACALEGNEHSMGIHAGGFVISSEPIPDVCAIYTRQKGQGRKKTMAQVIPYDKRDAEYLGMLKMDFLGLTAMGMVGQCIDWGTITLEELYGLFYTAPEYERERIMEFFAVDDVTGIFQYEGGTTRSLMRRLGVETFDHLAAVGALSRPGPFYGGQADDYIAVKNGEKDWERIGKGFDEHVEWTYGQIVYQEQIMWILRDLAGFDVPKVLRVRKIIGKKLGEHQFAVLWEDFKTGCADTSGIDEDGAMRIWGAITTAAGYAFNIAHAYSYALVAWWQMYLKIHFPVQFFAASLARNGDGKNEIPRRTALLQDVERHKIEVLPFDIEQCDINWMPKFYPGRAIQPGFAQIPGIAAATAEDIWRWRDSLSFTQWPQQGLSWDCLARDNDDGGCFGIGEGTVDKIKSFVGQSDPLGVHRTQDQIMAFRRQLVRGDFDSTGIPSAEEFVTSETIPDDNDHVAFVGLIANVIFRDEVESIRTRTGESVDEIKARLDDSDKTKKATVFAYDEFGEVALRVSRWQYPKLADRLAQMKTDYHLVVAWGRTFENKGGAIQIKNLWVFDPD